MPLGYLGKGIGRIVASTTIALRAAAFCRLGVLGCKYWPSCAKGRHKTKRKYAASIDNCIRFSNKVKVEKRRSKISCVRSALWASVHTI